MTEKPFVPCIVEETPNIDTPTHDPNKGKKASEVHVYRIQLIAYMNGVELRRENSYLNDMKDIFKECDKLVVHPPAVRRKIAKDLYYTGVSFRVIKAPSGSVKELGDVLYEYRLGELDLKR